MRARVPVSLSYVEWQKNRMVSGVIINIDTWRYARDMHHLLLLAVC